jgi:hypothetical protein
MAVQETSRPPRPRFPLSANGNRTRESVSRPLASNTGESRFGHRDLGIPYAVDLERRSARRRRLGRADALRLAPRSQEHGSRKRERFLSTFSMNDPRRNELKSSQSDASVAIKNLPPEILRIIALKLSVGVSCNASAQASTNAPRKTFQNPKGIT